MAKVSRHTVHASHSDPDLDPPCFVAGVRAAINIFTRPMRFSPAGSSSTDRLIRLAK